MEAKSTTPAAAAAPAASGAGGKKNQRKKKASAAAPTGAAAPATTVPKKADQPKQKSRDVDLGGQSASGGSDAPPPPKDLIETLSSAIVDQKPVKLQGAHRLQFNVQFRGLELSAAAIDALIAAVKAKGTALVRVPDAELRAMPDNVPRIRGPADYFVSSKGEKSFYVVLAPAENCVVYVPKAAQTSTTRDVLGVLTVDGAASATPAKFSADAIVLAANAISSKTTPRVSHKQLEQIVSLFSGFSFTDSATKALTDAVKAKGQTLTRLSDSDLQNLPDSVPRIRGPADYFVLTDAAKRQFYVVVTLGEPHFVYIPYTAPVVTASRGVLGDLTVSGAAPAGDKKPAASSAPAPAAAAAAPANSDDPIKILGEAIAAKKAPSGVVANIQPLWKSLQLTEPAIAGLIDVVKQKGQTLVRMTDDEIGALPESVPRPRGASDFFVLTDAEKKQFYVTLADGQPYVFFTAK